MEDALVLVLYTLDPMVEECLQCLADFRSLIITLGVEGLRGQEGRDEQLDAAQRQTTGELLC